MIICEVNWSLALEFLKAFWGWQTVTFLVFLLTLKSFKKEISGWLSRLRIKYQDLIVSSDVTVNSQLVADAKERAQTNAPETKSVQDSNKQSDPYDSVLVSKTEIELKDLVKQWRSTAYLWEYRYLNKFLVANTQRVLDWFARLQSPIDLQVMDNYWRGFIPSPEERLAILQALKQHLLVTGETSLEITPKGREYVEFRGVLPNVSLEKVANPETENRTTTATDPSEARPTPTN